MITITNGTNRQNTYANDIIRKPVNSLNKSIGKIKDDARAIAGKDPDWAESLLSKISVLHAAIAYYEQAVDLNAETFTAKYVIDNYNAYNMFECMMWDCISYAFCEAGLECDNPSAWLLY